MLSAFGLASLVLVVQQLPAAARPVQDPTAGVERGIHPVSSMLEDLGCAAQNLRFVMSQLLLREDGTQPCQRGAQVNPKHLPPQQ